MSNPWFRMYAEFAHDPKVQMLSEAMQRRLTMLLCLRCSNDLVTLQDEGVAFQLRISLEDVAETKAVFVSKGFIDDAWNLTNWDKRQFVSDSSYERVKRHRDKRAANGLPQQNYIPASIRKEVHERDGHACIYCGTTEDLTIDHDMPQSRGGTDEITNLLTACRACNAGKRDLTHAEYVARNGAVTLLKRPHIQNRTETEEKTNTRQKAEDLFSEFWKAYPRKAGKDAARKAFDRRKVTRDVLGEMLGAIKAQAASVQWQRDAGQFIPHPSTWLNEGRWQDEAVGAEWGSRSVAL